MTTTALDRVAFALLWTYAFSLPIEKSIEIPAFGTITKLIAVPAIAAGILAVAARRTLRAPGIGLALVTAWILWSAASRHWTVDLDYTAERVGTLLMLLPSVWLIWEYASTSERRLSLLSAYVLGTLAAVGGSVARFFSGEDTYYQRYGAAGFDPNDFALTMALSLPGSYLLSLRASGWLAWVYRLQMLLACGSILLSASRGGAMSMTVALSLIVWTIGGQTRGYKVALAAGAVAAVILAVTLVPATSWARLATLGSEVSSGTLNHRTVLWSAGADAYLRSPLVGVGAGAFPEAVHRELGRPRGWTPVAHNTFFSVLTETGAIGFLMFFLLLLTLLRTASLLPELDRKSWLVTLAVWSLGVFSLTWEHRKPTWFFFSLLMAHAPAAAVASRRPAWATAPFHPQRSFA